VEAGGVGVQGPYRKGSGVMPGKEQFGGLALEEVAEEVEGGGDKAQSVQDGGLEGHTGGDLFPGYGAHEAVHGLHQLDPVQHAGHQAQVA